MCFIIIINLICFSGARDVVGMGPSRRSGGGGKPLASHPPVPGANTRHRFPPLPRKIFRSVTLLNIFLAKDFT